jgi:hypothetical protein
VSISSHFSALGAPLRNIRWSWGAVDRQGRSFVRAWDDEVREVDGETVIRLTLHEAFRDRMPRHPGYSERLEHIQAMRNDAQGYVVICRAKDKTSRPRVISSFEENQVRKIAAIRVIEGNEFGVLGEYVDVEDLR